ncbi:kinase-like protein [Serendipita vermifera]|nr:kinase-like protein [Serendipita vermifera]
MEENISLKYETQTILGEGAYGIVFYAVDMNSGQVAAVKKSRVSLRIKRPILRHESRILQLLQGHPGIPILYGYGHLPHFEYLSLEIQGKSVKELQSSPLAAKVKTVVRVAEQTLSALEHIHSRGIVHRDIKPENLLVSLKDPSKVVFGLARPYHTDNDRTKSTKVRPFIMGTPNWASLNSHNGIELSPRDDLESLAYLLFFLLRGDLPWRRYASIDEPMRQNDLPIRCSKAAYLGNYPGPNSPVEFVHLLEYSRSMKYDQFPDYEDLMARFKKLSTRIGCISEQSLDWSPSDTTYSDSSSLRDSFRPGSNTGGDKPQAYVPSNFEGLTDSYIGLDVADYDIQDNRFRSLTMPVEQEVSLDQEISEIVEVQRKRGSLELKRIGLPPSKDSKKPKRVPKDQVSTKQDAVLSSLEVGHASRAELQTVVES